MKVEVREKKVEPPPREVVITMSIYDAQRLKQLLADKTHCYQLWQALNNAGIDE